MIAILVALLCGGGAFGAALWGLWQLVTAPRRPRTICAACREPTPERDLTSGVCWACARNTAALIALGLRTEPPPIPCAQCGAAERAETLLDGRCVECRARPVRRCAHCEAPLPWNHPAAWEGCIPCMGERITASWHQQRAARWAARAGLDAPGQLDAEHEARLVQLLSTVDRAWESL